MRGGALALVAALALSCGGPAAPGGVRPGPAETTAPAATAAATPTPSPAPTASPLVSAKGAIVLREPSSGMTVTNPVVISGDASVFEANLGWRIVTAGGSVLGEGTATATAGGPGRGTFRVEARFEPPYYGEGGFVEVFERSAKDGTITEIVRVPVSLVGSY